VDVPSREQRLDLVLRLGGPPDESRTRPSHIWELLNRRWRDVGLWDQVGSQELGGRRRGELVGLGSCSYNGPEPVEMGEHHRAHS